MKKMLNALIVILLGIAGIDAIASTIDLNVEKNSKETTNTTGSQNGNSDTGGSGNRQVIEK